MEGREERPRRNTDESDDALEYALWLSSRHTTGDYRTPGDRSQADPQPADQDEGEDTGGSRSTETRTQTAQQRGLVASSQPVRSISTDNEDVVSHRDTRRYMPASEMTNDGPSIAGSTRSGGQATQSHQRQGEKIRRGKPAIEEADGEAKEEVQTQHAEAGPKSAALVSAPPTNQRSGRQRTEQIAARSDESDLDFARRLQAELNSSSRRRRR